MSKTPAEAVKEHFWIGAKGGLLDLKHYLKMRDAVWLFMYLLRNQTGLNQSGEGVVNYGHPLTVQAIAADLKGIPERTIERWMSRLKREGYLRTESHSKQGITFWIAKGKDKTRKVKITHDEAVSMESAASALRQQASIIPPQMAVYSENIPPNMAGNPDIIPPNMSEYPEQESEQPVCIPWDTGDSETPIPKGFTSENLSYYNKDAAAQDAALPSLSLKEILKKMQTPKPSSQAEIDEKRRKLLLQAEEIKRKYPSKSSPGKVVEMQPQEATA